MAIDKITFESGYIVITQDGGATPTRYPVAGILRVLDIPTGLNHTQVGAITTLANLVVVLIRTLIDRQVLDDKFLEDGDYDLNDIIESIEEMGGDYGKPDITVT